MSVLANLGYKTGFYSPARGGVPAYPSLWRGCVGSWCPSLGQTGSTLRDESGLGNHGTLTNMDPATKWVASGGKVALDLDGASDQYILAAAPQQQLAAVTISIWWTQNAADNGTLCGFSNAPSTATSNRILIFNYISTPTLYAEASGGTPNMLFQASTPFTVGSWEHYAIVISSSEGILYRNGIVVASGARNITNLPIATNFIIGRDSDDSNGSNNGKFDDCRAYNRALTPSEIKLLALRRGIAYESQNYFARPAAFSPGPGFGSTRNNFFGLGY